MTIEIKVGPPVITISQSRTFIVTTLAGEILPDSNEGVYAADTRFVSFYRIFINRVPLQRVNSSQLSFYAARFHLTNPTINLEEGVLEANTLGVTLDRLISGGMHEEFRIVNYSGKNIQVLLELALRSDFADIFEVKRRHLTIRGKSSTQWNEQKRQLRTSYDHDDFHRAIAYQILGNQNYGTADATILYLLVLSEMYRWTGDVDLLKEYRDVALKCLKWIDDWGDLDGDGFQEYKTFSPFGYENVAWKDAHDAVVYADGSQVKQPKALCELQGYVYDAKTRMAEVFQALGEEERSQALLEQAQILKHKFNQVFWMEDEGCYAFGLDPDKKQITSIASNAGQCLWSGIADQEKAERTARRLLQEDMWSGWGMRTLSSKNPAYNPYSYQRGSVWPHDNSLIATGFKRYGLAEEANRVIRGMFDAIECFDAYRPPEVFAGLQRRGEIDFPALYPKGANIPQAWATGSTFQMIRAILGLQPDAAHKRLYVHPTLPEWLPTIELHHMRVGRCSLSLDFWREGNVSRWKIRHVALDKDAIPQDIIQIIDAYSPERGL